MKRATILMVEDDHHIRNANRAALELAGYCVLEADTLAKGRAMAETCVPDLIILDILLPDGNGLRYCTELRGKSGVRILFLSALGTKGDILAGLRAGGDDYIAKPYDMDELLVRVETLLRRGKLIGVAEPPLRLNGLEMDFISRRAYLNNGDLLLETKEFAVLEALVKHRGGWLSAQELYAMVWGMEPCQDVRTVRVRVSGLRHKLREHGGEMDIESKRDRGYRLVER